MISATMFRDSTKQELTEEQEQLKREIYERMNPRRRKFIDRIGYDEWDPFQKPDGYPRRSEQAHHAAAVPRVHAFARRTHRGQ